MDILESGDAQGDCWFLCLTMNLLGWNLPTGNENVKSVGGTWASLLSELPAFQLRAWEPRGCASSLEHRDRKGPLCKRLLASTTRGAVVSFRKRSHYWNTAGRASLCPRGDYRAAPTMPLLPLLNHRSQGTEPAGLGRSFEICTLADSNALPLHILQLDRWHRIKDPWPAKPPRYPLPGTSPVLLARHLLGPAPGYIYSSPHTLTLQNPEGLRILSASRHFSSFSFKTAVGSLSTAVSSFTEDIGCRLDLSSLSVLVSMTHVDGPS